MNYRCHFGTSILLIMSISVFKVTYNLMLIEFMKKVALKEMQKTVKKLLKTIDNVSELLDNGVKLLDDDTVREEQLRGGLKTCMSDVSQQLEILQKSSNEEHNALSVLETQMENKCLVCEKDSVLNAIITEKSHMIDILDKFRNDAFPQLQYAANFLERNNFEDVSGILNIMSSKVQMVAYILQSLTI